MNQKNKSEATKFAEKVASDKNQTLWEEKKLGRDSKFAKKSDELDFLEKSVPTSIRLSPNLISELKRLAKEEGVPYQTYLKMILIKHIKSNAA